MIYWPHPVYEILPMVYGATGLITVIKMDGSILGRVSGLLLLSAAAVIAHMRRVNRNLPTEY